MPTTYNHPHAVHDYKKLQSMIETLNNGGSLPPVIVLGYDAFTGSHRLAAWEACDMAADVIDISDADYIAALDRMGLDWQTDTVRDYTDFCDALYKVTSDANIKAAIEDQRG